MQLCEYGCKQKAKYYLHRARKWCCSKTWNSCPEMKGKNSPFYRKKHSEETKEKIRKKMSGKNNPMFGKVLSIKKIKEKYP
ncbi:MAG TPA: NUMOD3 domain-containing DNA-binding protein, partial [Ignavibacteriaceae bacterium]|nr:NUMOD3 domain-containing DNA-binding protein [Ignavibacteriaceae bacterium]